MSVIVATFGKPKDITTPGFDGKIFRFPVALIDRDDRGSPRQPSKIKSVSVRVEISDSRISPWGLGAADLVKVAFEIAKEHLIATLNSGSWKDSELQVLVNTDTHESPCPFDPALIQEPADAVVEIEVKHPIGFIWAP